MNQKFTNTVHENTAFTDIRKETIKILPVSKHMLAYKQ